MLLIAARQQADTKTKTLQMLMCAPVQRGSCPDGPHWRGCRCSLPEAPEEDPGDTGPTASEESTALNCMVHSLWMQRQRERERLPSANPRHSTTRRRQEAKAEEAQPLLEQKEAP